MDAIDDSAEFVSSQLHFAWHAANEGLLSDALNHIGRAERDLTSLREFFEEHRDTHGERA